MLSGFRDCADTALLLPGEHWVISTLMEGLATLSAIT